MPVAASTRSEARSLTASYLSGRAGLGDQGPAARVHFGHQDRDVCIRRPAGAQEAYVGQLLGAPPSASRT